MDAGKTITILSIDDKALTTDLDRAGYRKMGVVVKVASNYTEANKILGANAIDVLLINLDYDKVEGIALVKHYAANYKDMPVITTSVQSSTSLGKKAVDAGATLFIEQPIPRQHFIEKIKQALNQAIRDGDRLHTHGSVQFTYERKDYASEIGDLSSTGVLVLTDLEVPAGTAIQLTLNLPGLKPSVVVEGILVRVLREGVDNHNGRGGLGIRFGKFSSDGKKRLAEYMRKTARSDTQLSYYL